MNAYDTDDPKVWRAHPRYIRQRVTAAFKRLRKLGYFARQSCACCSGCAGALIHQVVTAMPAEAQERFAGAVFFHKQDAEVLNDRGEYAITSKPFNGLHIRYGGVEIDGQHLGHDRAVIGRAVVEALEATGLLVGVGR